VPHSVSDGKTENNIKKIEHWEERIIETLSNVITSEIQHKQEIILQLSGGLDSTALFLMIEKLLGKQQNFSLVHFLNEDIATSNESLHVHTLVQDTDSELTFENWQYSLDCPSKLKWNRPNHCILGAKNKFSLFDNFKDLGQERLGIINGHGGDQLFISIAQPILLLDYFLDRGPKGLFQKLHELCVLNRSPAIPYGIDFFKLFCKYITKRKNMHFLSMPEPVVWFKQECQNMINLQNFLPPFWDRLLTRKTSPGKMAQIMDTYHASATAIFDACQFNEVFPYLTQPMIEVGYEIPTFLTFNTEWSRLHFRRAISKHFRTDLVWRQSKGETSGMFQRFFRDEMEKIQEFCLEGFLAREKMLVKDGLNQAIYRAASGQMNNMWPLINLISLELFLMRVTNLK